MKNRKKAEETILSLLLKLTKSKSLIELYKQTFKNMSDKDFDKWMSDIRDGEKSIEIIIGSDPREKLVDISMENNNRLADELGLESEAKLIEGPTEFGPAREKVGKYLILELPFRRAKQTVEKGVSVAKNSTNVDTLTGQVKGASASSKISYPEIQLGSTHGLDESILELVKDRGGDPGSMRALVESLKSTGRASRKQIDMYSEGVTSSQSLQNYFRGMMIDNNIVE